MPCLRFSLSAAVLSFCLFGYGEFSPSESGRTSIHSSPRSQFKKPRARLAPKKPQAPSQNERRFDELYASLAKKNNLSLKYRSPLTYSSKILVGQREVRALISLANQSPTLQRKIISLVFQGRQKNDLVLQILHHADLFDKEFSKRIRKVLLKRLETSKDPVEEGFMLWVLQRHQEPFKNVRKFFERHFNTKVKRTPHFKYTQQDWKKYQATLAPPFAMLALQGYGEQANSFAKGFVRAMNYSPGNLDIRKPIATTLKRIDPSGQATVDQLKDIFSQLESNLDKVDLSEMFASLNRTSYWDLLQETPPRHSERSKISNQARRLNRKFKNKFKGKYDLIHDSYLEAFDQITKNPPSDKKKETKDNSKNSLLKRFDLRRLPELTGADTKWAWGVPYQDQKGLIWSHVLRIHPLMLDQMKRASRAGKPSGITQDPTNGDIYMTFEAAKNYCERIGGRLPTKQEFTRLRQAMGAKENTHQGYRPQKLAGFSKAPFIWTASEFPNKRDRYYVFDGKTGKFDSYRAHGSAFVVCVVAPKK